MENKQAWIIGDSLNVMQTYPDKYFDLILTDPPYGIGENGKQNSSRGLLATSKEYNFNDWDKERLDKKYFDEMLRVSTNQIIFGGNYYIDYLKPTSCFVVWNKDNGCTDFADCELAWTSFTTATRMFKYKWQGMLQGNMKKKGGKSTFNSKTGAIVHMDTK